MENQEKKVAVGAVILGTLAAAATAVDVYGNYMGKLTATDFYYLIAADASVVALGILLVAYGRRVNSRALSLVGTLALVLSGGAAMGVGGFIGVGTLMCCP